MINPVQGFKEASAPKKAAAVVGAAALIGSAAYAIKKGEGDTFVKKVGNGYAKLGTGIKDGATNAFKAVAKKAGEIKDAVAAKFGKGKEVAEEVAEEFVQ